VPVSYSFDSHIVVVRGDGDYATDELKATTLAALADAACPARPVLMFDLRTSHALTERTAPQVEDMGLFLADLSARYNGRMAMVVSSLVGYGLMRMGTPYAETKGGTVEVFKDYDEARRWLLQAI